MKKSRVVAPAFAALLGAMAVQAAYACEISKTPWGLRITGCKLSYFFKKYDFAVEVAPNRPMLRLPNLGVADIDGRVNGTVVDMDTEVENNGTVNAIATFEITAIASVHNPLTPGAQAVSSSGLGPVQAPGLAAGATRAHWLGQVTLPNRTQDWDVCATVIVDPPVVGGPQTGSIWESNETDNVRDRCCRVYGPKPDLNGPRAC